MTDIIPSVPQPQDSTRARGTRRRRSAAELGLAHRYGDRVFLADDLFTSSAIARMCSAECSHTDLLHVVRAITARLAAVAFGNELPGAARTLRTRMADKHGDLATWTGDAIDPDARVVVIDVIRGGMVPAQTCFELLSLIHPIERLRLDHLSMQRIEGADGHVERVELNSSKVGGSVEGATVVIPDPMGATGATIRQALEHLEADFGRPAKVVLIPIIATPEFLRTVLDLGPHVVVYAGRLDRGMSSPEVLACVPGARWDEESGLDDSDYIVPGAGGVGELLNNSWA